MLNQKGADLFFSLIAFIVFVFQNLDMPLQEIKEDLKIIKESIEQNQMVDAIKLLLSITRNNYKDSSYENKVILYSRFYHENNKDYRDAKITHAEYQSRLTTRTTNLLTIISEIEKKVINEIEKRTPEVDASETNDLQEGSAVTIETETSLPAIEEDLTESSFVQAQEEKESVVEIQNLEKRYRKNSFCLKVEKLQLETGTITALVGENATGKTTLIRILAGELAANKGWLAYPLLQNGASLNWVKIKKQIAYIPQHLTPWHQDLYITLCHEAVLHGIAANKVEQEVNYMIHRLGLAEYIDRKWSQLSGGYKLRFALAKALIWRPRLLLIDEPLAHLDVRAQLTVLTDLKKILTNKLFYLDNPDELPKETPYPIAVFLSSQHIHEIEPVSDQILFMRKGILENCGDPKTYNAERNFNHFELTCNLPRQELKELLEQLPCRKIQYTGISTIITTDKKITGPIVLQFFNQHEIVLFSFRDISQSIILKFYEN